MNPKTLEEAKKIKYGFAWDMKRRYYIDGQCAFEVWNYSKKNTSILRYQCQRKNGHGINGLYCKQHAKKVK